MSFLRGMSSCQVIPDKTLVKPSLTEVRMGAALGGGAR
jgi:hypothetical protein